MNTFDFSRFCRQSPDWEIDWQEIESEYAEWVEPLKNTQQNTLWHGEGDVWTHTRMAVEKLVELEAWKNRPQPNRIMLFIAVLLHDIGKSICTKIDNGRIVSPKHGLKGAMLARKILWMPPFNLAGTPDRIRLREGIVSMIRLHSMPCQLIDRSEPVREVVRSSMFVRNDELAILSTADLLGRIHEQKEKSLEKVELFRQFANENHCLTEAYHFASERSRFAYFNGILDHPSQELYDGTWGEIILMSGVSASGKDHYVSEHFTGRPVISLDEIRDKLRIDWTDNQGPVINAAKEQAKEYLRNKIQFVWNATNLSREIRSSLIRLFSSYNTRVRIVYMETDFSTLLHRNRQRQKPVLESAIFSMLDTLEFPTVLEADRVDVVTPVR